jgi:hypothetical protein
MAVTRTYLQTLITEKGRSLDDMIVVEGPSGPNHMPLEILVDAIAAAPHHEREGIHKMLVRIDFANGDVFDYFKHLARAIAI